MDFLDGSWVALNAHKSRIIDEPVLCSYKKELSISNLEDRYEIGITADAKYKLYINDVFVNFGPQKGNKTEWFYDRIDCGPYFAKGSNTILVVVLSYPTKERSGNHSLFRTDAPGLFIGALSQASSQVGLFTDTSWQAHVLPIKIKAEDERFAPLTIFEEATTSDELIKYKHVEWKQVDVYPKTALNEIVLKKNLKERTIPFQTKIDKLFKDVSSVRSSKFSKEHWEAFLNNEKVVEIPAFSKEIVEINAGEETTGFIRLCMSAGKESKITLLTSECYAYEPIHRETGPQFPVKGDRTDSINGKLYGFTDTYTVYGHPAELYEPFWFRTFRYLRLEIETQAEPLILRSLDYVKSQYPLEIESKAMASDESLSNIWDISERTLRCCMHDTYEDCPFYEQLQYIMDTRSQILYTYATSMDDCLARRCMNDFKIANSYHGLLNASAPNYENNVIPGFSVYYIGMIFDHMSYFGDRFFMLEHVDTIKQILHFYHSHMDGNGLVSKIGTPLFESPLWSFIDWTPEWNETIGVPSAIRLGQITMESLLYLLGLQYSIEIFDYLNLEDLSKRYLEDAEKLKKAIRLNAMDEFGIITDGPGVAQYSQHCQVFGILTGIIDKNKGREILKETLNQKEKYSQCSVAMMFYLFRALELCGLYEETDKLWNVWRSMLDKNLTTCEEDGVNSRSDCHAWGALILYEYPSTILGVRPFGKAYEKIEVNPNFGHLDWAKGSVITAHGLVDIDWVKKENRYIVNVFCENPELIVLNEKDDVIYNVTQVKKGH